MESTTRKEEQTVVVASLNPAKVSAVSDAFTATIGVSEVISVAAEGGSAQPIGDAATRDGARRRALGARLQHPEAQWWVGIEGGIEVVESDYLVSSWVVVMNEGCANFARTAAFTLPRAVGASLDDDTPLGVISEEVAEVGDWRRYGLSGTLTSGKVTRQRLYADATLLALSAFLEPWKTVERWADTTA
ncbi:inosine/xanthosine triphosphatase [Amycolatopsis mediterranei]|uniref:inosine/xanthosine triphosphatase n=1 Tax=Amycolatopsis mediterranei TaxID=33910 RepID=UPI003423C0C2